MSDIGEIQKRREIRDKFEGALISLGADDYVQASNDRAVLLDKIAEAHGHLVNLQPHIAELLKSEQPFIDSHVTLAMKALEKSK